MLNFFFRSLGGAGNPPSSQDYVKSDRFQTHLVEVFILQYLGLRGCKYGCVWLHADIYFNLRQLFFILPTEMPTP